MQLILTNKYQKRSFKTHNPNPETINLLPNRGVESRLFMKSLLKYDKERWR